MAIFYFTKEKKTRSPTGGTNYKITVYKNIKSGLKKVGDFKVNTAAYRGYEGEVAQFLHEKLGYELTDDSYRIKRKDVKIKEL